MTDVSRSNRKESFDISSDNKKMSGNNENIKAELEKYAKKGSLTPHDYSELIKKYGDEDFAEEVLKLFNKRYVKVKKQAKDAAEKIVNRYRREDRTFHEILSKMLKIKKKYGWSDVDYAEFQKELSLQLRGDRAVELETNLDMITSRSKINRAIGPKIQYDNELNIKESEHGVLSEILSMVESSGAKHRAAFMGSLIYEDCSIAAISGEFKRDKHNPNSYIHPLLICMFIPKFLIFETHMIYASIGRIVKSRYEKKPIVTEPDLLLLDDLITDPNDVVCDVSSPIIDLKNRFRVQISIWDIVQQIRAGNYYDETSINQFTLSLNACRNNLYDGADLAYHQDEGAILRRLLSVFSIRPTYVTTKPISTLTTMPYVTPLYGNQSTGQFPFTNAPVYTIAKIQMIIVRIPPFVGENDEPINLKDALNQVMWMNENKMIIPKEQSIIYSKEILIFYVNRRIQRFQFRTLSNPVAFSQLPLTMSNFDRLNKFPIHVPETLRIKSSDEAYHLRSIVAVTETEIKQGDSVENIITGNVGLIMSHRSLAEERFESNYLLYDPFGASVPIRHNDPSGKGRFITNKPFSFVNPIFNGPDSATSQFSSSHNPSFFEIASRAGTIYIYSKPEGYNQSETIIFN
uniref:Core protein n=1 Tax=viral metagenome TaxID=1070528 RepID=A0A6C0LRD3_9ZZZZ